MTMLENFKILTVTHKQAPLNVIGDFVIKTAGPEALRSELESIKAQFGFSEFCYLSTCNRVLYFFVTEHPLDTFFAAHFFQRINGHLPLSTLESIDDTALMLEGEAAIQHLLEVAASIDSMVIGERQILGQLREAYDTCHSWGLTGDYIRLAIQNAVMAAKEIYAQTRIGDKPISIVSLAIQKLLRANLPKQARILLVGAGQTNALVAKFLNKHHFTHVTVFNRSIEKAQALSDLISGTPAQALTALPAYTAGFDCMIVCTGATEALITPELYAQLLAGDTDKKVVIDLSLPNNVARETVEQFNIQYIEIENLRQLAKENLAFREQEINKARVYLKRHLAEFPDQLRQRKLELALSTVPTEIKAVKAKAINEVFKKEVEALDQPTRDLIEQMLTYMEKKCIGIPMKAARAAVV